MARDNARSPETSPHPRPVDRSVPAWCARAGHALAVAASRIRVIACNTPVNLRVELERLAAVFEIAKKSDPYFLYEEAPDHGELRRGLEALAGEVEAEGELGGLYAARALELCEEATLCEAAGGPGLWPAARRRFAERDRFDREADQTAAAWLAEESPAADSGTTVRSDDERDPGSLVCRMRSALGKLRVPFRVVVNPNLASLAATGEGVVQVVQGRVMSRRDVDRTVLHEVEGHVLPRHSASRAPVALFAVATRRGLDDQEGRALAIERARGFLDLRRRREIALRHVAARAVAQRAGFVETVALLERNDAPLRDALRIAARVHRGGGLAREAVYLPALLRVEDARRRDPAIDKVLAAGRISVDAAPALARWSAA
jgi:hypothetical protein